MFHAGSRSPSRWLIALVLLLCLNSPGCVGLTANMLYWIKGGHTIPAEFSGLAGKRVAVVCVANTSSYGPNAFSTMLERAVAIILQRNVKKITIVHPDEVAEWIDRHDWDQMDYREIGRGVSAEMVVGIDLDGIRLHDSMTLYKGRADVAVTVFDMAQDGRVVFRKTVPDFTFPRNGARHTTEMSETRFRQLFVTVLAQQIAKYFYEYRLEDDFAQDAFALNR